ncbi:hypothetical protein SS50377_20400 [Spironucleus salmonicida]|uniref:Uncharacterized protein n=1 Tax=Spironucleus salmonicida TaxID=348837 RepID=V6LUF4_9EUKA|nr:hypothetical protein SS50377_20400 [Spironucleus salmonicida]|eukprot:EST48195.1 Hypothetical protein SS50377_11633 [Spironucleus salmonicida]
MSETLDHSLEMLLHLSNPDPVEQTIATLKSFQSLKMQRTEDQKSRYTLLRPGLGNTRLGAQDIANYDQILTQEEVAAVETFQSIQAMRKQPTSQIPANFSLPAYPLIQQLIPSKSAVSSKFVSSQIYDTSNFAPEPVSLVSRRVISLNTFKYAVNKVIMRIRSEKGAKNLIQKLGLREDQSEGFESIFRGLLAPGGSEKFLQKVARNDVVCDPFEVARRQGVRIVNQSDFVRLAGFEFRGEAADVPQESREEVPADCVFRALGGQKQLQHENDPDRSEFW